MMKAKLILALHTMYKKHGLVHINMYTLNQNILAFIHLATGCIYINISYAY